MQIAFNFMEGLDNWFSFEIKNQYTACFKNSGIFGNI